MSRRSAIMFSSHVIAGTPSTFNTSIPGRTAASAEADQEFLTKTLFYLEKALKIDKIV